MAAKIHSATRRLVLSVSDKNVHMDPTISTTADKHNVTTIEPINIDLLVRSTFETNWARLLKLMGINDDPIGNEIRFNDISSGVKESYLDGIKQCLTLQSTEVMKENQTNDTALPHESPIIVNKESTHIRQLESLITIKPTPYQICMDMIRITYKERGKLDAYEGDILREYFRQRSLHN
jgi:hypothetical protein